MPTLHGAILEWIQESYPELIIRYDPGPYLAGINFLQGGEIQMWIPFQETTFNGIEYNDPLFNDKLQHHIDAWILATAFKGHNLAQARRGQRLLQEPLNL